MPLLTVENLTTKYYTETGWLKAVDGVSFELQKASSVGIVGESGCGKSTLVLSIAKLLRNKHEIEGKIKFAGLYVNGMLEKDFRKIRWKRISIVPQASMGALNPVYTIGKQIEEAIIIHRRVKKKDAWQRVEELLERVGINRYRSRDYPHELSGGMCQRVVIAMALALDPDLVIADEPTTALDAVTQVQILKLLKRLQKESGISMIYISHDLAALGQVCDEIIVMYGGKIMEKGRTKDIFSTPFHPYTKALLNSFPDIHAGAKNLVGLAGSPPNPMDYPTGCRFHPRCQQAQEICRLEEPSMDRASPDHHVACHFWFQGGVR